MRQADINRVSRAAEHIRAALTNLDSIKDEHMTPGQHLQMRQVWQDLSFEATRLETWAKRLKEGLE